MSRDVFISHASKDKAVADEVCAKLESQGFRCWIAPRDIGPGALFAEAISDAIPECRILLLVLSSNANVSDHVPREVDEAVRAGKPIIPFKIEDVEPSTRLRHYVNVIHTLDAHTQPLEAHLQSLAKAVQELLHHGNAAKAPAHSGENTAEPLVAEPAVVGHEATRTSTEPGWVPTRRRKFLSGVVAIALLASWPFCLIARTAARRPRLCIALTGLATLCAGTYLFYTFVGPQVLVLRDLPEEAEVFANGERLEVNRWGSGKSAHVYVWWTQRDCVFPWQHPDIKEPCYFLAIEKPGFNTLSKWMRAGWWSLDCKMSPVPPIVPIARSGWHWSHANGYYKRIWGQKWLERRDGQFDLFDEVERADTHVSLCRKDVDYEISIRLMEDRATREEKDLRDVKKTETTTYLGHWEKVEDGDLKRIPASPTGFPPGKAFSFHEGRCELTILDPDGSRRSIREWKAPEVEASKKGIGLNDPWLEINGVALSRDNRFLLVGTSSRKATLSSVATVSLWDLKPADQKPEAKKIDRACYFDIPEAEALRAVAFANDEQRLLAAYSVHDRITVYSWDRKSKKRLLEAQFDGKFATFSADGACLATWENNVFRVFDVETGEEKRPAARGRESAFGLAISNIGEKVAVSSLLGLLGEPLGYGPLNAASVRIADERYRVSYSGFDGTVASGPWCNDKLRKEVRPRWMVAQEAADDARRRPTEKHRMMFGPEINPFSGFPSPFYRWDEDLPAKALAFSAGGDWLLIGRVDGRVDAIRAKDNGEKGGYSCKGHAAAVTSVAFSPDGSYVISGGNDRRILFWK
jgi:WD40 repeat protein